VNINLYLNHYVDSNPTRQAEIEVCLKKNLSNPSFNVVLFESQGRVKYKEFFNFINQYTAEDDINIISNLDIYYDESIELCRQMGKKDFYALSRWDIKKNRIVAHYARAESQDTWVFRGRTNIKGDFYLGLRGCDNRLAYEAKTAGYDVHNPSHTIKIYHFHSSRIRNYSIRNKNDVVPGPYVIVPPTSLNELDPNAAVMAGQRSRRRR
jgi:hypothetical protein